MATKDSKSNTSKTAHVLNLLSKNRETPPQDTPAAEEKEGTASAAPAPAAPVPPILSSLAPDAEVSVQIKGALEEALEDELIETAPEEAAPVLQAEETAPPQPEEAAPAPQAEETAPLQPEEAAPAPQAESDLEPEPEEGDLDFTYVNVMQTLVEENVEKYMKTFGLCQCPRCISDVKALTLNNLPPKYVVIRPGEMVPRITVYEGRYSAAVTAQLLHACMAVMEKPHHDR
ncbi:hypothetical protein D1159_13280 [Pseudoflavonifractor sp. 524-17]|uniref:late competence development ComFB family protein n=1 Tax=Pseudoflavonifractor sp. 524-17 TaxID=2304577 RepID=UPI0013794872|nr:late competence development ComFB family protein [Pseudoflavonifractor sp. 524-17]NCE65524.1 hypothetical protein [Pseudoflavonifractor sp. 524-17]